MRLKIEADEIGEAEDAGLGNAHRLAHHRIGLLNGEPRLDRLFGGALQPIDTDAIGNEPRRILAAHDTLAQSPIGEIRQGRNGIGASAERRHDLQ